MKGKGRNPFRSQQSMMQEKSKLVGAYLPLPFADYLRLLSVYFEKSLQGILQEIIVQWGNTVGKSEKEIMDILIERAVLEWQRRIIEKGDIGKKEQEQYLQEIQNALECKKIAKKHLDYMVKKLKGKVGCIE
jgi:hypothetical protein